MDRQRIVAGLDVHKDSVFLCVIDSDGAIIFQKTYGTLTPELYKMRDDMVSRGVSEAATPTSSTPPYSAVGSD